MIPAIKKSSTKKKAPAAKAASKPAAPAKKTAKPAVKKAVAKKAVMKKAAAKKVAAKKPAPKTTKAKSPRKKDEGKSIESLIARRNIDLKSVEEALGLKTIDTKHNPLIPGKFDLIIPPGVPRRLIVDMAREYNLEIAMRNDYYVPIGVSDVQRELLCFRGDEKTIKKTEKELFKRLKAWAE